VLFRSGFVSVLRQRSWPGNARQLRNVIERVAIVNGDRPVLERDLLGGQGPEADVSSSARPSGAHEESADASPGGSMRNRRSRRRYLRRLFRERQELTRSEIVEVIGCAPSTATRDLKALMSEGCIERVSTSGHLRTSYFRIKGA
jgi:DNA-binding NtrC family response regulator